MSKLKTIIRESSLSRIWKHVSEHDSGTISAERSREGCSDGDRITKATNNKNSSKLKSKLLSMGYGVTKVMGTYIENYGSNNEIPVKEVAFVVIDLKDTGKLKSDLIKLGTYFNQDSITFSKPSGAYFLISTNTCPDGYPGKGSIGKSVKLGKSFFGKSGQFYSSINGRPFTFESVDRNLDTILSYSISEIRSIKHLAESVKI